jgi:hypothetical protein
LVIIKFFENVNANTGPADIRYASVSFRTPAIASKNNLEKFESIDAISEGNMPSWYRFQRNAGN